MLVPCLSAAVLVSETPCVSQSASTLVTRLKACTLAGQEGRITSLTTRFFLFGVGLFFVLSLPGYFKDPLATGVLRGACDWSLRFLVRVFRAFSTLGTALAAIFAAALTSLSITPCSGQTEISCTGWLTLESQIWHTCEVFLEFAATTQPPFCDT